MPGATRPAVGAHEHAVGVRLHAGAGSAEFTGSARATRYGPGVPDDQMPTDEVETQGPVTSAIGADVTGVTGVL